jgi:pimeloyl-ACP methyl ester carboxylesterase
MFAFSKKVYLFFIAALIICCISLGMFFEQKARLQALIDFPPRGELVDIGDRKIHLDCRGNGSPIIIFESGFDTSGSISWSRVHNKLSETTRTCAYDRAGMMWSESRSNPETQLGKAIAEDLNKTLLFAGEKPPYVLVGHSFGGPYITIFTKYFQSSVAGLVFIDTSHPDQIEIFKEFEEPLLRQLSYIVMDFFEPIWSFVGLTRYFATLNNDRLVNQSITDEQAIDAFSPASGLALTQESHAYEQSLKEASSFRDFGDIPLYVIGAISNYEKMSDDELTQQGLNRKQVPDLIDKDRFTHKDQASWSTNSELRVIYNADHYVQFEKPDIVVEAILSVVQKARVNSSLVEE